MPEQTAKKIVPKHSKEGVRSKPVLFVLNSLGLGGSERKTIAVVNELHRLGLDIHLAHIDDRAPLRDRVSPTLPVLCLRRKGKVSLAAIIRLRAYIRQVGIGKIVCINLHPFAYAEAALYVSSRRHKPEVVLFENSTEKSGKKAKISMLFYRLLLRRAAMVVFGSQAQLQIWHRRYGVGRRKSSIIYNGIDEAKFAPGAVNRESALVDLNIEAGETEFILGAVGTLWPNKNHVELISALDRLRDVLPSARLVIAGDGPERERLEAAVQANDLKDRVNLLGRIDDVRPFLEAIDVFILPSISETFSNAVLEAMSMENAVIVSDTGGMAEMITDGVDGYLYKRGDIDHLAKLIRRLAEDTARRKTIGRNARATVLKRFTFKRMVSEYRRLLS